MAFLFLAVLLVGIYLMVVGILRDKVYTSGAGLVAMLGSTCALFAVMSS